MYLLEEGGCGELEKERSTNVQRWSNPVSGAGFQGTEEDGQVNTETVRSILSSSLQ